MSTPDFDGSAFAKVEDVFTVASQFAENAYTKAESFVNAINATVYAPPTLSVTWNSLTAPTLPSLPAPPVLPDITFSAPGGMPAELTLPVPSITIDDFSEPAPTLADPLPPTINYGMVPTVPSIGNVPVPEAPTLSFPEAPTQLGLNIVSFPGLNLREEWLDRLDDVPTLDIVEPTPYGYARGPEYASALLEELKAKLLQRMQGGTGLDPLVEQAIWDRARDRETLIALGNEADISRQSEALGYKLPPGVLTAQLRAAQQNYYDKLSGLSRDIAIKQAELEQANLKDTIASGMQMESTLIDYSYKMEQLAFEISRAYADNAIQVHNANIERFRALLQGYESYANVYKTIIDSELAKVEVYKAQLDAENTKATINKSLVDAYKAEIEASMAQVEIYRAQVSAAQTLVQLEEAKIGAAGEQIRAYVAQVNAETAKVEAYKAQVGAEATKVEMYRTKAQAFSAKVGAQAERARAEISRYSALYQAKASEWDSYRARVQAESERIRALGVQSNALLDGYRAATAATVAEAEMNTKVWEGQIKQYEAGQNITLQAAKINADSLMTANNARLDAAKVGAQVFAQLTSSAYGMMNASASVSGSRSMSVGYSYSNDTDSTAPTVSSI